MSESERASVSDEAARRVSRAAVVKLGAAGVAGAIGVALAEPASSSAATGQDFYAQNGQLQEWGSAFGNSNGGYGYVFGCSVSGNQVGVDGSCASGVGVQGTSTSGNGVRGISNAGGPGSGGAAVKASAAGGGDGLFAAASGSGRAVHGEHADSGSGVHGVSDSGDGVRGESTSGDGVTGLASDANASGVRGDAGNGASGGGGVGVRGTTGGPFAVPSGAIGVHGVSNDPYAAGAGVYGIHHGGGSGVWGQDDSGGVGVTGSSSTNVGVHANAEQPGVVALQVTGPAVFSRSGIKTIAGTTSAPKSSVKVTGVALTASSLVLATIQTNNAPGVFVQSAVPNVANSWITISLNQAVSKSVKVAWFIVN